MLISLSLFLLWIYAFEQGNSQIDRVNIFNSYFPEFLHGRFTKTYFSIALCVLSIVLSSKSLALKNTLMKTSNIIIMIISGILLCLNLFSMM